MRYLHQAIRDDLKQKMVFIGGPRQVGKTTLAQSLGAHDYKKYHYLNWDNRQDRKKILSAEFKGNADLIVFDEIHKYRSWKNFIKGLYDTHKNNFNIMVTGSARLDLYRRGGDSMMGRYHYYRLHPFSLSEFIQHKPKITPGKRLSFCDETGVIKKALKNLLLFGGFPEPFLKKNMRTLRRFHQERLDRLIKEDIRDIESIRDLSSLDLLAEMIPTKVGSLFSLNSLREDLQVTHKTLSHWTDVLERFYYHYRITPFTATTIKSLRKEPKLYLWDWSQIENESIRFENMIASHLLKTMHFLQDFGGYKTELHFLRDIEGREVDFLLTLNKKPWLAVEVKSHSQSISKPLLYFKKKLNIPFSYQVLLEGGIDFQREGVRVMSAEKFLTGLV